MPQFDFFWVKIIMPYFIQQDKKVADSELKPIALTLGTIKVFFFSVRPSSAIKKNNV